MNKKHEFIPLFRKFISDGYDGKRLSANGSRIRKQSIDNYVTCLNLVIAFQTKRDEIIYILEEAGNNQRSHLKLKKYYKNFHKCLSQFLFQDRNCHDNYVGLIFKQIKAFFKWLNRELGINTGFYYLSFYTMRQEIPVFTLSIAQLRFLMFDKDFENSLPNILQQCKDVLVFGCLVGLRYSDLLKLSALNIQTVEGIVYLKVLSQKTRTFTSVKLPPSALLIIEKYRKNKTRILPCKSLCVFNQHIKEIAFNAGWTYPLMNYRTKRGVEDIKGKQKSRFCDMISSHIMRRTCITIMLTSGIPELVVKKVSGHSNNSRSFFRYVNFAQEIMDSEIDKMHRNFEA
jgi:integrase